MAKKDSPAIASKVPNATKSNPIVSETAVCLMLKSLTGSANLRFADRECD